MPVETPRPQPRPSPGLSRAATAGDTGDRKPSRRCGTASGRRRHGRPDQCSGPAAMNLPRRQAARPRPQAPPPTPLPVVDGTPRQPSSWTSAAADPSPPPRLHLVRVLNFYTATRRVRATRTCPGARPPVQARRGNSVPRRRGPTSTFAPRWRWSTRWVVHYLAKPHSLSSHSAGMMRPRHGKAAVKGDPEDRSSPVRKHSLTTCRQRRPMAGAPLVKGSDRNETGNPPAPRKNFLFHKKRRRSARSPRRHNAVEDRPAEPATRSAPTRGSAKCPYPIVAALPR